MSSWKNVLANRDCKGFNGDRLPLAKEKTIRGHPLAGRPSRRRFSPGEKCFSSPVVLTRQRLIV
jgi:hypothetical protein